MNENTRPRPRSGEGRRGYVDVQAMLLAASPVSLEVRDVQEAERWRALLGGDANARCFEGGLTGTRIRAVIVCVRH